MMDTNSELPAFPTHADTGNMEFWKHGLTKKEYLVSKFAAALLANGERNAAQILESSEGLASLILEGK